MSNLIKIIALSSIFSFSLVGCKNKNVTLNTDEKKASYTIGWQIGQGMKAQGVKVDVDVVSAAITDVLSGKESRLTDEEKTASIKKMRENMMNKRQEEGLQNKKTGAEFLKKNKSKEGIKTTKSGLQYKVLVEGKGKTPSASSKVKVHYVGTLIDGTEFDSSRKRGTPAEFPVKGVIPGWTEALMLMPAGSKWMLYLPSELAYGERGRPSIPANSVLIFEVELLEVMKDNMKGNKSKSKKVKKKKGDGHNH